jgi:hypothetical protein
LRFLLGCMTDEELARHDLIERGRKRPAESALMKAIDRKLQRFQRAHSRLARATGQSGIVSFGADSILIDDQEINPQYVACSECTHVWVGFYLPQPAGQLAEVMRTLSCPRCLAGAEKIRMRP